MKKPLVINDDGTVESRQKTINKTLARWRRHKQPKTLEALKQATERYFEECSQLEMLPGVETYALYLGIDRSTLYRWKAGKYRDPEWRAVVISAYQTILAAVAVAGDEGTLPPLMTIFREKQLGYRDGQTFEQLALDNSPYVESYQLPSQILARYSDDAPLAIEEDKPLSLDECLPELPEPEEIPDWLYEFGRKMQ